MAAVSLAIPPGRSLIRAVNRQRRPSTTSPWSMTRSRIVRSMFPPQSRSTVLRPASSGQWFPSRAASAEAAAPSTTVFSSSSSRSTASESSASSTVTTWSTSGAASGNDTSPTRPTARPSASVGWIGTWVGRPAASDALKLGAAAVSTATMRMSGRRALAATATPASSPAPPVGTTIAAASGTSSRISSAIVPCPAITRGSSKPWIRLRPSRSAISAAPRRASSKVSPSRITRAPSRRHVATFTRGANRGITTVTGMPRSLPW